MLEPYAYPLKQKYRVYRSYNFGTYRSRTGNSHAWKKLKLDQGNGPRRKQGLGAVAQ